MEINKRRLNVIGLNVVGRFSSSGGGEEPPDGALQSSDLKILKDKDGYFLLTTEN